MRRRDIIERDDCTAVRVRRRDDIEQQPARRRPHRLATRHAVVQRAGQRAPVSDGTRLIENRLVELAAHELAVRLEVAQLQRARIVAHDATIVVDARPCPVGIALNATVHSRVDSASSSYRRAFTIATAT